MIAISSTSSYGRMMIATFGYKQKYVFLWMMIAGYKQKFLFKKKSALASFLPSFARIALRWTHPLSLAFILAPALRYNLTTHSLSFTFLASSRSYTFSPHKPTIPPCVSNLISKLVLEAFPFPISKTYNLSWIFLFCLFACVCVCVFCLGEFAVVADYLRQREKKSSSSSSVCV